MEREATITTEAVLTLCALRFDGYQWSEERGLEVEDWDSLVAAFVRSGSLSPDPKINFAIFFRMQRTLCKAGNGFFGASDDYSRAAVQLFLQLVSEPTPRAHLDRSYEDQWTRLSPERRTNAITCARSWLTHQ